MKTAKKGAIPIPYIIAIIFGVIVLALITFWLFFTNNEFRTSITEKICEGKRSNWCSQYELTGKAPGVSGFSAACSSIDDDNRDNYYAPDCCSVSWAPTWNTDDCDTI
jgi:hypothetical protein